MRMCHFRAQNGPFVMNKIFLVQTIIITFIYLLALFIVQNLKKFLQRIQSYEDAQFLGPKWPISPNDNFFRKPSNEPYFFHSCLSTCQISDSYINLLVKYWQIKNTEKEYIFGSTIETVKKQPGFSVNLAKFLRATLLENTSGVCFWQKLHLHVLSMLIKNINKTLHR